MLQKASLYNVRKGKTVVLSQELPVSGGFGNSHPIPADSRGEIVSEGFIMGMLQVQFYTHTYGTQITQFNELSAGNYLMVDIY